MNTTMAPEGRALLALGSLALAFVLVTAASSAPASAAAPASATPDGIRGMTISCRMAGQAWGSDSMVHTLEVLKDMGINWVAIHPYGGIRADGTVGRSGIDRMYDDPYWLTRAIEEAHRLDMKILIKPHIAYWGTAFSWRGEILFETDQAWERFFTSYEEWIVKVARLSADADGFVVGTELDQTCYHEIAWRQIIASVRKVTTTPLTYSAGWDTYESVPFWDALDVIGIQAYFPLVEHENAPTPAELEAGWVRILDELQAFGDGLDRDVVLGELGYNRTREAAVRPWAYRQESIAQAEDLQLQCYEAALAALERNDRVLGAFLWKWFPGEYPRGNFRASSPRVRELIAKHWLAVPGARRAPSR